MLPGGSWVRRLLVLSVVLCYVVYFVGCVGAWERARVDALSAGELWEARTCQLRLDEAPQLSRKPCGRYWASCMWRRLVRGDDYRAELPVVVQADGELPEYTAVAWIYPDGVYNETYARGRLVLLDTEKRTAAHNFTCWKWRGMEPGFVAFSGPIGKHEAWVRSWGATAALVSALMGLPLILSFLVAFFPSDDEDSSADTASPLRRFVRRVVNAQRENWLRRVQSTYDGNGDLNLPNERPGDAALPPELRRARAFARERRRAERLTREQSGWLCDRLYVGKTPRGLDDEMSWNCAICLEGVGPSADQSLASGGCAQVPCGHQFHKRCLRRWLRRGKACCPLCNFNVKDMAAEMPPAAWPMETSTAAVAPHASIVAPSAGTPPVAPPEPPPDTHTGTRFRERDVSPIAR